MRVRIGKEKENETTASFNGEPSFDPTSNFDAVSPSEKFLNDATMDPGLLFAEKSLTTDQIALVSAQTALANTLRQQQYIVYDIASQIGVLSPLVGATQNALKGFDVILSDLDVEVATAEAITTGIGVAAKTLSAIPTIYTQIAGAIVGVGLWVANMFIEYKAGIPPQMPAQAYSKESDLDQFNTQVRTLMGASWDWTSIFMPRFKGELASQVREDDFGRLVVAFAPGDGDIAKVNVAGSGKNRHAIFPNEGVFDASGGLGMIPGGQRILSVVQVTPTEAPVGPAHDHATIYDPRCGSIGKASYIDIGSWYPTTAQGALSLWDFIWQRGAAMYTVDPVRTRVAWAKYFGSIWRGVDKTWGKKAWQGGKKDYGWGCGFWQNALSDLVHNYTVSSLDGRVGGTLSWSPISKADNYTLGSSDQKQWEKVNAYAKIIKPALDQLEAAQIWYLENTTIAAYLPIEGGQDADPSAQSKPMGAFERFSMRTRFNNARKRILSSQAKYEVRLRDVLDPIYRAQIEAAGGGTQLGFAVALPGAPPPFEPEGGSGLPGIGGLAPRPPPPTRPRSAVPYIVGGLGVAGATAAGYYYWDDITRLIGAARQRIPRRFR